MVEQIFETCQSIIKDEHEQMLKTCEKCEGNMVFVMQALVYEPTLGDIIIYRCEECHYEIEKFFPFPEEYARLFLQGSASEVREDEWRP